MEETKEYTDERYQRESNHSMKSKDDSMSIELLSFTHSGLLDMQEWRQILLGSQPSKPRVKTFAQITKEKIEIETDFEPVK